MITIDKSYPFNGLASEIQDSGKIEAVLRRYNFNLIVSYMRSTGEHCFVIHTKAYGLNLDCTQRDTLKIVPGSVCLEDYIFDLIKDCCIMFDNYLFGFS